MRQKWFDILGWVIFTLLIVAIVAALAAEM
jgi:hypothetical protein